jgi:uncharacterized protein YndB with AHSA1/START domain
MKANLIAFTIGILASTSAANLPTEKFNKEIVWPAGFHPSESKFYVENEIEIQASPAIVWSILVDAESWPTWYEGAKNVAVTGQGKPNLTADARLDWETMGLKFDSEVKEFEPTRRLAWLSEKKSIQGYHIWIIIPTQSGCRVVTAETQNGWLTFFEKTFQPNKLHKLHAIWLSELKAKAEKNAIVQP